MAAAERHRFVILTKLPGKAFEMLSALNDPPTWFRQHHVAILHSAIEAGRIMLGTSFTDQLTADIRIPQLCTWPGKRFVSYEPALGWMMLRPEWHGAIHGVAIGCESGPGARPTRLEWVRALIKQCMEAKIPVMVKQLRGEYGPNFSTATGYECYTFESGVGFLFHLPEIAGRVWAERPACLKLEERE